MSIGIIRFIWNLIGPIKHRTAVLLSGHYPSKNRQTDSAIKRLGLTPMQIAKYNSQASSNQRLISSSTLFLQFKSHLWKVTILIAVFPPAKSYMESSPAIQTFTFFRMIQEERWQCPLIFGTLSLCLFSLSLKRALLHFQQRHIHYHVTNTTLTLDSSIV